MSVNLEICERLIHRDTRDHQHRLASSFTLTPTFAPFAPTFEGHLRARVRGPWLLHRLRITGHLSGAGSGAANGGRQTANRCIARSKEAPDYSFIFSRHSAQ